MIPSLSDGWNLNLMQGIMIVSSLKVPEQSKHLTMTLDIFKINILQFFSAEVPELRTEDISFVPCPNS